MAVRRGGKSSPPTVAAGLGLLKPAERQLVAHVISSMALQDYRHCCNLDSIAQSLGKNPKRLQSTLKRLAEQGWLHLDAKDPQTVYPTVAALRWQDPTLNDAQAKKMLRSIKR